MNDLSIFSDELEQAMKLCTLHIERMTYARSKVEKLFPLTKELYVNLKPEELSFFDQFIFRFSKLQDAMGNKLFPSLLRKLGEDLTGLPFIDILSKLEQLSLIENRIDWLKLRETRNTVIHDYPFISNEVIEGLNLLNIHSSLIISIWEKQKAFIEKRFTIRV